MFLNFLFPQNCVGCQKWGAILCNNCQKEVQPTVRDVCPYCFQSSPKGMTHTRCSKRNGLDGAISVVRYNTIAKKIVKGIKYKLAYDIYNQVTLLFPKHWWRTEVYKKLKVEQIMIQPIPLHVLREKSRGFNQSDIIAKHLSKQTKISIINTLKRIKNTAPQARIATKEERKKNIKGAFMIVHPDLIKGKTVLLVDDIFTSASTAKEAASVLKQAGAEKVLLYTFAHGS